MIATHNVKINGRWYHNGERIPDPVDKQAIKKDAEPKTKEEPEIPAIVPEVTPKEELKEEPLVAEKAEIRQKTTPRRKGGR